MEKKKSKYVVYWKDDTHLRVIEVSSERVKALLVKSIANHVEKNPCTVDTVERFEKLQTALLNSQSWDDKSMPSIESLKEAKVDAYFDYVIGSVYQNREEKTITHDTFSISMKR